MNLGGPSGWSALPVLLWFTRCPYRFICGSLRVLALTVPIRDWGRGCKGCPVVLVGHRAFTLFSRESGCLGAAYAAGDPSRSAILSACFFGEYGLPDVFQQFTNCLGAFD